MEFSVTYRSKEGVWIWRETEYANEHVLARAMRLHVDLEHDAERRIEKERDEWMADHWTFYCIPRLKSVDKHRCFFCGCQTEKKQRTRDHLWPKCRGGVATVMACYQCNSAKGKMTLEQFRYLRYGGKAEFFGETVIRIEFPKAKPSSPTLR